MRNPMAHKAQVQVLGFERVPGIRELVPTYAKTCSACGQPVRRMTGLGGPRMTVFYHSGGVRKGTKRGTKLPPRVRVTWPLGAERLVLEGDPVEAGQVLARVSVGDGWVDVLSPVAGTVRSAGDGRAAINATVTRPQY